MALQCPNCKTELVITAAGSAPPPASRIRRNPDITPLTDVALGDVHDVLKALGERKAPTAELYRSYISHCADIKRHRPLTKNAFARALGLYGAERYRTAKERGFILPPAPEGPLTMTFEARERLEQAYLRQEVTQGGGGGWRGGDRETGLYGIDEEAVACQKREVDERIAAGLPPF